ncbi:carbon-nitrogen hydrolase family protein [Marinobacterium sedimentorum]|uniref:carbon-nitrogen hydrolase family protein n=1 Tax=Marinobacterium sedimentorum TaxID=2927804 RepID=UPI0020C5ED03|nr:carbon-nitrogen hydrolase family protein [Marinobacterium sedimentorum]MCP8688712.1 carbon-nitrogen hydrolase family protein [Marinobacterium sedimentorum]
MGIQHPKYKVAAVQAAPAFLDLDASVDKTIAYIEEAAASGAKLVAFPELWIPGYPWWVWLGTTAWAIRKGFVQRYFDNALSYGSPEADRIREAVRRNNITAVIGLAEREGGTLYIAQWLLGPDGETLAQRRKIRSTHQERTVFGEGDGSDLAVHDTELGRLGALNCWENILSMNKYAMYSQHEQIHVASWPSFSTYDPFAHALSYHVNNAVSKVYAVEGSCFVIAPSSVFSQEMLDMLCDTPDKLDLVHVGGGHTVIFGPDGSPLCDKLPEDQEGILYADVDLGIIGVAKNAMDPVGHYSRPDVTRLLFNKKSQRVVEHMALPINQVDTEGNEQEDSVSS